MEKDDFRAYLIAASYWAIQLLEKSTKKVLSYEFAYDVELNQSMDKGGCEEFAYYPEDDGKVCLQQSIDDVVALLVRDSKVPVWIDIDVKTDSSKTTTLRLVCAGRFTNKKDRMYYSNVGQGPFGIKIAIQIEFDSEEGGV